MRVLLTSDDGPSQPTVRALDNLAGAMDWDAFRILLDRDRSGSGGYLRPNNHIALMTTSDGMVIDGYPAEVPYLATQVVPPADDVWFVSVNRGYNVGTDMWNSGTVMSCVQARWLRYRACAISLHADVHRELVRGTVSDVMGVAINRALIYPLTAVNIPPSCTGIRIYSGPLTLVERETTVGLTDDGFWIEDKPGVQQSEGGELELLSRGTATVFPLDSVVGGRT